MTFAIGNPGRAAVELPHGNPPTRVGPSDAELSAFSLEGMLIRAASCRGLMHRATGTHRQDAFALSHQEGHGGTPYAVAVVCDGVGQYGRSDEAAQFTSRRLASLSAQTVPWPEAFIRANGELSKLAVEARADGSNDPDTDGMATTAVAVTVRRDSEGWTGEAAWVGDSTLWHLSLDAQWTLITDSRGDDNDSDYHSTAVRPLPTADGKCSARDFNVGPGALFVMTDGVANPLRWSGDVRETLAGWWMRPPDPFTFAAQVDFARKSHMDDRTVIGIWPEPGEKDAGQESESRATDLPR